MTSTVVLSSYLNHSLLSQVDDMNSQIMIQSYGKLFDGIIFTDNVPAENLVWSVTSHNHMMFFVLQILELWSIPIPII